MKLELILVDPNAYVCNAWRKYFDEFPDVEIILGRFEDVADFDCMVSPANSFGLMDGGVDAAITHYFGQGLMKDVQEHIIEHFLGEQPVGTSFIIGTRNQKHPWLAHTPTMRVPMEIARTDNVYLAMFAMLLAIKHHNDASESVIRRVLCPGLGTGTGRVPPLEAARQMSLAYRNYLNPPSYIDWRFADKRQSDVRYGGDMGMNFPPTT